jgi:hypothetical protein
MPQLVLDVLYEIGAFCAGAFDFRTLVNLSLTCKALHEAVKPVLDVPVLVLTRRMDSANVWPKAGHPRERVK